MNETERGLLWADEDTAKNWRLMDSAFCLGGPKEKANIKKKVGRTRRRARGLHRGQPEDWLRTLQMFSVEPLVPGWMCLGSRLLGS